MLWFMILTATYKYGYIYIGCNILALPFSMRQTIERIGCKAAASGKPVAFPSTATIAVDWLVEHGFAAKNSDAKIVLMSTCIASTTTLTQPNLVELPDSSFGLRKKLFLSGWEQASKANPASVVNKSFRATSCVKPYFMLLLERIWAFINN